MTPCCTSYGCTANAEFDARHAAADLARYRKRGPDATTRLLLEGIRAADGTASSLLDIGAGIGVVAHELLTDTVASAVLVDASGPYVEAACQEAARRGTSSRSAVQLGDLVELAPRIANADAVTMDRVICCYPEFEPLLDAALDHAERLFAFSYPRDRWWVHAPVVLGNLVRRLRRTDFRVFIHPPVAMHALIEQHGFRLVSRRTTIVWSVEVWQRH